MTRPVDLPATTSDAVQNEREFFDGLVGEHGEFDPFTAQGWDVLARAFRRLARPNVQGDLLDIGCGTGSSQRVYAGCYGRYTGVDLSPVSIEIARKAFPELQWQVADACRLPFADESFDTVAFSSVLHHLPAMPPALAEAHRVLKPGGVVFAFDPNVRHPAMALFRHPRSPFYISQGVSLNERPLNPPRLRAAFEAAGFQSIQQRCQSGICYREVAPRRINAALSAFNFVDTIWERIGIGRWLGTFVLTSAVK
jgi:ubiquinone/menaquinone biosynthesis C-methylase UbiE